MEKKINFCGNCPFFVIQFDNFESVTNTCNLARFQKKEDYSLDFEAYLETPEWCPLKKEEYLLKFKKFSPERINEINSVKAEIEELEAYFSEREYYHTDTIKNEEYVEKDRRLIELYSKLDKLHENEELSFYQEDFQNDILQKVNEIRDQLSDLENAGAALQEAFSKIGNIDTDGKINL